MQIYTRFSRALQELCIALQFSRPLLYKHIYTRLIPLSLSLPQAYSSSFRRFPLGLFSLFLTHPPPGTDRHILFRRQSGERFPWVNGIIMFIMEPILELSVPFLGAFRENVGSPYKPSLEVNPLGLWSQ